MRAPPRGDKSVHKRQGIAIALISVVIMAQARTALAQEHRLQKIEDRLNALEHRVGAGNNSSDSVTGYFPAALACLGIGLFCGFWARNSGRDFWLWFSAGLVFNVFALIAILIANDEDKKAKKVSANEAS